MPYLFDTDAISEVLKPKPAASYLTWLQTIARDDQFTSAVVIGELYKGAYRSPARDRHLKNIENRVLPAMTVLPYDTTVAQLFGEIHANLERRGQRLADADLMIASTTIHHNLELVTGNLRHFERIDGLRIRHELADSRSSRK